jgi:hypothetical protein
MAIGRVVGRERVDSIEILHCSDSQVERATTSSVGTVLRSWPLRMLRYAERMSNAPRSAL